jgi:hypothetical protein
MVGREGIEPPLFTTWVLGLRPSNFAARLHRPLCSLFRFWLNDAFQRDSLSHPLHVLISKLHELRSLEVADAHITAGTEEAANSTC